MDFKRADALWKTETTGALESASLKLLLQSFAEATERCQIR